MGAKLWLDGGEEAAARGDGFDPERHQFVDGAAEHVERGLGIAFDDVVAGRTLRATATLHREAPGERIGDVAWQALCKPVSSTMMPIAAPCTGRWRWLADMAVDCARPSRCASAMPAQRLTRAGIDAEQVERAPDAVRHHGIEAVGPRA